MPGFRLGDQFGHEIAAGGSIGLDLDAGIFRLETFSQLFVRATREGGVPDDFAFGFGTRVKPLFTVRTHVRPSSPREGGFFSCAQPLAGSWSTARQAVMINFICTRLVSITFPSLASETIFRERFFF